MNFHQSVGASSGRGNLAPIRFADLRSAGSELASPLESYRNQSDVVVLAIVLGGVLVAHELAARLALPLDVVIIRRLLAPRGPGSQTCAVSVAGTIVLDDDLPPPTVGPLTPFDFFVADALNGLEVREKLCRGGSPPTNLARKTVIMVDCGMYTGSTMQAAIRALRTRDPLRIVAAVPVASRQSGKTIEAWVDELVCLDWPEPFGHVGLWYKDFRRPGDEALAELLHGSRSTDD